ncbi:lymphocyte antigen 6K isoform X2 [Felis catus]|uniref:UPAR/Ly6 domain-containing protein n=1 Tax=Felis catus TaxID=9685 RepID=A0ABI7VTY6_FELCA|nr:lymphocyte antigen 6K isoform X2 [Felis catus]
MGFLLQTYCYILSWTQHRKRVKGAVDTLCGPGTTETMILFALLLVTGLSRVETNVTVSGKQAATLKCHVCEIENSFGCTNPSNCPRDFHFCTSVAVRIYPRFFYVSKQCSRNCPVSAPFAPGLKSFVLVKPMPFLYAHCCSEFLCNTQEPNIREPEFREGGRASRLRSSGAWLAAFLTLSSV